MTNKLQFIAVKSSTSGTFRSKKVLGIDYMDSVKNTAFSKLKPVNIEGLKMLFNLLGGLLTKQKELSSFHAPI